MPIKKAIPDAHAMAFLTFARQYHSAAEHLFDLRSTLSHPVHFLYFHAVELALKAYLRSFNVPIEKSHNLTELYEECRRHGLVIGPADRFEIANIVSLLESGNKYQGFRYFTLASRTLPELSWTREVVQELMRAVEERLEIYEKQNPTSTAAVKFDITFGKPVEKTCVVKQAHK